MGSFPHLIASRLNSQNLCNFNKKLKISPKNYLEDLFHLKPHLRLFVFESFIPNSF